MLLYELLCKFFKNLFTLFLKIPGKFPGKKRVIWCSVVILQEFEDLFSVGLLITLLTGIQQNTVCPGVSRCLHSTVLHIIRFDLLL